MSSMDWKVDVSDYMGHKYEQYKNKLNAAALTRPSDYYKTQSDVLEKLNETIAKGVYETFYNLLTKGILPDGSTLKIGSEAVIPSWPAQAATTFSLEASNQIDDIISKCVEIILPKEILDISKMRLEMKSKMIGL